LEIAKVAKMAKQFMGLRLRRLREEQGLTQAELARAITISPSYLNQIEQNQRPLTVPVLLKLNAVLGLDVQLFAEGDNARRITALRAALSDQGLQVSQAELRELANNMPEISDGIIALHAQLRAETDRADLLAERLSEPGAAGSPASFEVVRDWFYDRSNYLSALDLAGEAIGNQFSAESIGAGLTQRLAGRHGIRLAAGLGQGMLRRFDPETRILHISSELSPNQQAFQMATQLAFLEQADVIAQMVEASNLGAEGQGLLRIGLGNYFAGAVLLPYLRFLNAAEETGYDLELLARRFQVGIETICHRLSTLQRDGARGVAFFFMRVDRAGNISKRQSATDFHFFRAGGSCPLWNVYEAFSRPGEILRQIARMPDGRGYLWLARALRSEGGGFDSAQKSFAIALGCELSEAHRLVYARGLDLHNADAAVKIGPGCKLCDRPDCVQRAFPAVGKALKLEPEVARFMPYAAR